MRSSATAATVETQVGDAVMVLFGIPVAHQDDALRAVRAAAERREEVVALRGELRRRRGDRPPGSASASPLARSSPARGVAAGSFTAGDKRQRRRVRLGAVGGARRHPARPETFRLVRHAVDAEPVAPLTVEGKSVALEAFRLVAVAADARARAQRPRAPMVGRERERRRLLDAFENAISDRSCQLFTVLSAVAGVGKLVPCRRALGTGRMARGRSWRAAACPTSRADLVAARGGARLPRAPRSGRRRGGARRRARG